MNEKNRQKLTTKSLESLSKAPPDGDVWDIDLSGFHVRPGKRGLTFRLYYRSKVTAKRRMLTLGTYGKITAHQARQMAVEALAVVAQGGDPREKMEKDQAEARRLEASTLGAYLDDIYAGVQGRKKDGKATLARIRNAFPDWLNRPMSSFTRADAERWQARREALGDAFATSKRSFGALKTMLNHAAERQLITANPFSGITLDRPAMSEDELAEKGSQRRYLEEEEVSALFKGLEEYQESKRIQRRNSRKHGKPDLPDLDVAPYVDHVVPWIMTMYYTGFRPGDLFGLRWEQVNLKFATIRKVVEKTAHKRPEPITFPLSSAAVDVLTTWHEQNGEPSTGLVFPSPRGDKRMSNTAMQKPWRMIRKLGGLPENLQIYTLRHNFASQLVMAGVDLLTVSKLMAHSDIQTTIGHYAHLRPDHARDAVEAFCSQVTPVDRKMGLAKGEASNVK